MSCARRFIRGGARQSGRWRWHGARETSRLSNPVKSGRALLRVCDGSRGFQPSTDLEMTWLRGDAAGEADTVPIDINAIMEPLTSRST